MRGIFTWSTIYIAVELYPIYHNFDSQNTTLASKYTDLASSAKRNSSNQFRGQAIGARRAN